MKVVIIQREVKIECRQNKTTAAIDTQQLNVCRVELNKTKIKQNKQQNLNKQTTRTTSNP